MNPMGYVLVFVGGGLGAALRHGANQAMGIHASKFPIWTFVINVVGCLAMGVIAGWFAQRSNADQNLRLFLTTGILGGFTTFSAYSLDAAMLWQRNDLMGFFSYVLGTVVLCLIAVFAGLALSRVFVAG